MAKSNKPEANETDNQEQHSNNEEDDNKEQTRSMKQNKGKNLKCDLQPLAFFGSSDPFHREVPHACHYASTSFASASSIF